MNRRGFFGLLAAGVASLFGFCRERRGVAYVDEVNVFNRCLTKAEIERLYAGETLTTGLVSHWKLDEVA